MSTTTRTTEREMYLQSFEREYQTTLRVLRAYPADQAQLKWNERSSTAMQTAWMLAISQFVVGPILTEATLLPPDPMPPAPADWATLTTTFEQAHAQVMTGLKATPEAHLETPISVPVGPGQMAPIRRLDALWMMLMDTVHHRGQLSVYLRASGAKVPSIYGPSGDERW